MSLSATFYLSLLSSFILVFSTLSNTPQPQTGVGLENVSASYRYGEQITFSAQVHSATPIGQASIVITDESNGLTQVQPLLIDSTGHAEYRFDVKQNLLRPFSTVKWQYQFGLVDGTTFQSQDYSVRYEDNRFDWQTLETGAVKVHWYNRDPNFGQAALNAAQAGLDSSGRLISVNLAQPIDVYIYASADDLRGTLVLGGEEWVAGHADPALGVVMVLVEPGADQNIIMEQRIPHELMHVMTYRSVGTGYRNLPAWLREGLATLAEIYPNADYDRVLREASTNNSLIPLKDLCGSFPSDAGQAFLSYAESRSFVNYLHDTYGSSGLQNLMSSYADGIDCENGPERAVGVSLFTLEQKWRASILGGNRLLPALQNISPYLVLLCLVLIIPFIGIISTLRKKGNHNGPGNSAKK